MDKVTRERIVSELHLLEEKAKLLGAEPLRAYLIGGGNLALRGLKSATKDIDIVVLGREQFTLLQSLLETPVPRLPIYRRVYRSQWEYDLGMTARYEHPVEKFSLDVFVERILNKLYLSEGMVARAEVPGEFSSHELFEIYLVSKEDIFLFKTITSIERVRDVEDLVMLVEAGLDFEIIIQELKNQLSMDNSLRILIPGILDRIDVLMEQIGTVKGLVHFKEYLEEANESL
ncbi:hypothetical protein Asulf_00062 [Archaeoglobus sulfaticallidus PM70-1]|uniref:Nucleotidyltransferase n=1 Tax=Archaeoglobus sulfaticallidus PM70-1 TaxID=387631 RepID=N0BAS6_9EURY|nr:hypothetical protein [Archaeoglobus sulfaticallidus]AGK60098.1 hypothetical protein Asulf_00062 [Archaeoglobus sulfaticallidus PM70-1]